MRSKLFYKLFVAFILTFLTMVLLLGAIVQFAAQKNFSDYVKRMELQQLDDIAQALAQRYAEQGSWDWLRGNHAAWVQLIEGHLPEAQVRTRAWGEPVPPQPDHEARRHRRDRPQPGYGPPPRGTPPPYPMKPLEIEDLLTPEREEELLIPDLLAVEPDRPAEFRPEPAPQFHPRQQPPLPPPQRASIDRSPVVPIRFGKATCRRARRRSRGTHVQGHIVRR
ncbi:hypothetical protein ACFL2Q_01550 [Thermodesulfobacteriota bacterium]